MLGIPPSVLESLPPIGTAILVLLAGLTYVVREWRKGLSERATEAERRLKETREESETKISGLQKQIEEMREDFDRQFAELRAKLNEQIEALQSDNIQLNSMTYRLRQRLAENGVPHEDIT